MSILFHFPTEVSDLIFFETVDTLFHCFFCLLLAWRVKRSFSLFY